MSASSCRVFTVIVLVIGLLLLCFACEKYRSPQKEAYFPDHPKHQRQGGFPELGKSDFLITASPGFQNMRERGCFFLGIWYPMPTDRYSPPNFNDHPSIPMESQVDMMIYTWGPKEDFFLITPALTPHLKICPTSPMTIVAYWALMAQIAHNSSRWEFYYEAGGTAGSVMGIYPFVRKDGFSTAPLHDICDFSLDSMSGDKYGVAPYYRMSWHVPGGKAYDDSIQFTC